ncbi:hypothetical protein KZ829_05950 [Actinoplanes hulinensis]|uniref:Uncharacterized protein n=1 Tax=Actinoplanes hulinensis TaxID=1144547 RepID=A0ABS7AWZ9_9ACTN|nr:hypothetical protein [Actinoplanes hulinensis]MBW6433286.1 hypothetical protein [Actinoplanes hulinensis]
MTTVTAADLTPFRPGAGRVTAVAVAGLVLDLVPLFSLRGRHRAACEGGGVRAPWRTS